MIQFRIVSINVRGASNEVKRKMLYEYYRVNADIIIMQETHSEENTQGIWKSQWGGEIIFSHGTSTARGIAIFTTKEIYQDISNIWTDDNGRIIIIDILQKGTKITIAAIYAPNQDTPSFFQHIQDLLRNRSEHKIVIGDFNVTLDVEMDRLNTYCNNNKAKDKIEDIMDEFCLKDIWRTHNPQAREFSWIKRGRELKASRIDLALVSAGIDQCIKNTSFLNGIKTDHRALYMVVEVQDFERGKGFWKFNNTLLKNKQFLEEMNLELTQTIQSMEHVNPIDKWERIKSRIKKKSINYSKRIASENSLVIAELSEKVFEYESKLPLGEHEDSLYIHTKQDLEEKLMEKAMAQLFRSKVKWQEEGEKNTKYFFALEKARYNAKTCYKLIDDQGVETLDPQKILEKQKDFYQELYSKDPHIVFDIQNTWNILVPPEVQQAQEQQLTVEDLKLALYAMNNNKTPGGDGIPADLYKVFWKLLQNPFYDMVIEVYEQHQLHSTAREGILNLIPKPGKDSRYVKNLRPITLLNVDYKIIEKAIANKMKPALLNIIHQDQRGFMENRRISVNIRKMLDIMHEAEREDLEAVVLSLDFVKCFDKCSFDILHGSLEFFQFGLIVKEWTKILYDNFTVKVQNNGNFSESLEIQKGVHQGGCCSSLYFLVIAEILAISLRHNADIQGITIREIINLLNQFADDMDIFSMSTERSLRNIHQELMSFHQQSGFEVSYEKTTLYRIGSLRHSDATMYNIKEYHWSNRDIKVLGVTIAHEDLVEKNYKEIVSKAKKVLFSWYNRGLTLLGKVQVVNTLIASLFVYKMMVLPTIPESIIKIMDNIIREFLWNKKKAKIAYPILQNPKKDGGLNLVNLRNRDIALKATWPQILEQETEYAKLVYYTLRIPMIGEDIWRCNLEKKDIAAMKTTNQFWKDVLSSWSEYNYNQNVRIENQIIWYNTQIRIRGKPIMWNDIYKNGLKYLYQLFKNQKLKTLEEAQQEFGLTHLRYNSLVTAIPREWKTFFTQNSPGCYFPIPPHNFDIVKDMKHLSRRIYQHINGDKRILQNKYIKWKQDIELDFCQELEEYCAQHVKIYKTTNITKYRAFQYRLLQRSIVTNQQLYRWGIIESETCTFCQVDQETIAHLFFRCPIVKNIWSKLKEYLHQKYKSNISIQEKDLLFNQVIEPTLHVANFLCLVTKQYIYRQRCFKKELRFKELEVIFVKTESIEKYIAMKNGKIVKHNRKWLVRV